MRVTGVILVATQLLVAAACTASTTDWDAWYDGEVQVQLHVQGGEGAAFPSGSEVSFEFEATESAYHMVIGIDPQGDLQLLFPRFWEDSGWVRQGSVQKVQPCDFAVGRRPWRGDGVVYVEVVSSPTPFDWERIGLRRSGDVCRWSRSGHPAGTVSGDAFDAFNELHRRLFPRWDNALFTVDSTWFFLGARCAVPRHVHAVATFPVACGTQVLRSEGRRIRWDWQFGAWCARPLYRRSLHVIRHGVLPHDTRQPSIEPATGYQQVRVESDPRARRKVVTEDRTRDSRQLAGRVVVRQDVVKKKSEFERRKLK